MIWSHSWQISIQQEIWWVTSWAMWCCIIWQAETGVIDWINRLDLGGVWSSWVTWWGKEDMRVSSLLWPFELTDIGFSTCPSWVLPGRLHVSYIQCAHSKNKPLPHIYLIPHPCLRCSPHSFATRLPLLAVLHWCFLQIWTSCSLLYSTIFTLVVWLLLSPFECKFLCMVCCPVIERR